MTKAERAAEAARIQAARRVSNTAAYIVTCVSIAILALIFLT